VVPFDFQLYLLACSLEWRDDAIVVTGFLSYQVEMA
jgi:hypothetical protein